MRPESHPASRPLARRAAVWLLASAQLSGAAPVLQVDLQMAGTPPSQETQAGWPAWEVVKTQANNSISTTVAGIGITITSNGGGWVSARGGTNESRGGEITGTSWDDAVEDFAVARGGDNSATLTLAGLDGSLSYTLTVHHNDSYALGSNPGFALGNGLVTPTVTIGTSNGSAGSGTTTNIRPGARTDASFSPSTVSFMPTAGGDAGIRFSSTSNFVVFNSIELIASASASDRDDDGINDDYELAHTDPPSPTALDPHSDDDGDGLTNLQEYLGQDASGRVHGFGPTLASVADSDGDGLPDGEELSAGNDGLITNPNAPNVAPVGLVISEIHYDPDPNTELVEFIELHNTDPAGIDVSGWRFGDGIEFTFPSGTIIGAGEFALIGENAAALAAKYFPPPATAPLIFQYAGALDNDGESLELRDDSFTLVDRVDYRAEFPWPISPNGEGDSMQLINPGLDNDLAGSWRSAHPTPGAANSVFAVNAPPHIRQVDHTPAVPAAGAPADITVKVTDPDGVSTVQLHYQVVAPGNFIPACLPLDHSTLTGAPATPLAPNPAFEDAANWITLPMLDDGSGGDALAGDSIFTASIPGQANRSLVRYRITAGDALAETVRVPYADDPSLNFAYFVYDGVPDWTASSNSVHPDGPGHVYPAEVLGTLPVYTMIARDEDRAQAYAYASTGNANWQIPKSSAARRVYNWECALVHDGVVYDHVGWRLRQSNDRYSGDGKRSMRYRLNRGHYFQARDEDGNKLPVKWRRMNTGKMSRFDGTSTFGLTETVNSRLWRMVGVECPRFLPVHFRMIDGAHESPDQYHGDFFGLATIMQDIDGRLLDDRILPDGNIYKLRDGETSPLVLQRNQSRLAVTDGSDFLNIRNNLGPARDDAWLRDHVDWNHWARYHAVVEAVRHYDYGTPSSHWKNRAWSFQPETGTPHGLLRVIPHDHDASWLVGYHDNLNSTGNAIGTGFPWHAIFGGTTRPPMGPEKPGFTIEYRNFLREFRDLLWQEETVHALIDEHTARLAAFSLADRDRWTGGPAAAGVETMTSIENIAHPMKSFAFVSDTMFGTSLPGGRAAYLDQLAADPDIPDTPAIHYSGPPGFPAGGLLFTSSDFADPQGAGSLGGIEWRIAEVNGPATGGPETLVASGDTWRYFDSGTDPGAQWAEHDYDDLAWGSGPTQIGYGESDQATTVAGGHATTYFRKVVHLADPALYASFAAGVVRDDGAIVHVNGVEVWRNQMPDGPVDHTTTASASASGANETDFQSFTIPAGLFYPGSNTIAVEVHQHDPASGDMSFDFQLTAIPPPPATSERIYEWNATWESGALPSFQPVISPPAVATRPGRTYRARVRHADNTGRWSHWSAPLEFTAGATDLGLFTDSLVISEIMYHPTSPTPAEVAAGFDDDDVFEFVEILNVGNQTIDLGNLRFTKGIEFDFAGSAVTRLAPGGYVLVVNNQAAFEMRYGSGLPVAGEWSAKLDNGGERLKLSYGAGEPIRDFTYDDAPNWPAGPDGGGPSLVLAHPFARPDHRDPFNWRASVVPGGSPGTTDGTTFPGGSRDELLAYATGGRSGTATILPDGNVAFTIGVNQLADDVVGWVEVSTNLVDWMPAGPSMVRTATEPGPGGMARVTFTTTAPPTETRWFIRYAIELR